MLVEPGCESILGIEGMTCTTPLHAFVVAVPLAFSIIDPHKRTTQQTPDRQPLYTLQAQNIEVAANSELRKASGFLSRQALTAKHDHYDCCQYSQLCLRLILPFSLPRSQLEIPRHRCWAKKGADMAFTAICGSRAPPAPPRLGSPWTCETPDASGACKPLVIGFDTIHRVVMRKLIDCKLQHLRWHNKRATLMRDRHICAVIITHSRS